MHSKETFITFCALLRKDIEIYNRRWIYRAIDALVWVSCVLLVAHHIMPLFGIENRQYGTFTLLGHLAVWGLLEMLTSIAMFLADLQGDHTISYYLSLPIPSTMLFVEQACASAYKSMASSILIVPIGKIILGNDLNLTAINWPCCILAFFMLNMFYGFFTLFVTSYVPDLPTLTMVRSRIMFPLWFLGGCQFSWKMLHQVSPTAAYINLCNPIVYIMDGIRSTALPTDEYLPFWLCMAMLVLFSALFGFLGIRKLKQRLDCI
jgi:ABC-type polysaccharide/polyol phosphate export permease